MMPHHIQKGSMIMLWNTLITSEVDKSIELLSDPWLPNPAHQYHCSDTPLDQLAVWMLYNMIPDSEDHILAG